MVARLPADSPKVEEFTADPANSPQVVQALIRSGGVIIRNLLSQSTMNAIESDVRPYILADKPWTGDFFPPETRRVYGLAGKSPIFIKSIVADPLYQSICDTLLTSVYSAWTGQKLETSKSPPQLNNTIVFSINPGARNQELHRDDMLHHNHALTAITPEEYKIGRDTGIGFFVAGKKATKANGATRFIPGSHLWDQSEPPNEELAFHAEMNAGDAFMMLSSCYHGGSANTTEDEERLLYSCFMTKGYLRQEENQYLANPLKKVREYSEAIQKIIGYQVSAPFLGWLDLDDPRKALYSKDEWKDNAVDLF
ncbi:phytanoyl-CoA dioxygenase family protein [Podospora didyma]|uniref:Phytanoyl-CoA dioxygenase family protein n=1 Tax=Podospora didyma TaxID=330526 RepID=A0AAE0NUF9_9PEZI|nr:phytanoyl-CoA dioxygenase family protein [Podospora didyma]